MFIAGRFRYYYKRNFFKYMTIICIVNGCPWKITCHDMGASHVVQVHTFVNEHRHTVDDIVSSQPLVRCNRALNIIDDVILSTPEYTPRQICKDFVQEHGVRLSYTRARKIKEKAKERIHSQPNNYHKLLP